MVGPHPNKANHLDPTNASKQRYASVKGVKKQEVPKRGSAETWHTCVRTCIFANPPDSGVEKKADAADQVPRVEAMSAQQFTQEYSTATL